MGKGNNQRGNKEAKKPKKEKVKVLATADSGANNKMFVEKKKKK